MCGIFACLTSSPEVLKHLLDGLARLEYRGYDSAGVCLLVADEAAANGAGKEGANDAANGSKGDFSLIVEKAAGKVSNLKSML